MSNYNNNPNNYQSYQQDTAPPAFNPETNYSAEGGQYNDNPQYPVISNQAQQINPNQNVNPTYATSKDPMKQPLNDQQQFGGDDRRFRSVGCQDCIWAILFYIQLGAIIGLSAYYYSKNSSSFNTDAADTSFVNASFWKLVATVAISGLFSAVFWIFIIRKFAHCLIWFSLILTLAMWIAFGIISLSLGNYYGLVIALIFAAIQALWMFCVRDRIAFAAAVLTMAVTATNKFSGSYVVSFLSIFVQAFWMIVWLMGFAFVIYDGTKDDENNVSSGMVFLFLVSFYWTAQVIANVVHVTSAGVVATWYFLFPMNTPSFVTGGALKRSMTTSFGSICFGSFLVAVIQAIRAMIRGAQRSRNGFITCLVQCILACIQNILEYFNLYAFTRVAIYGSSYCQSAKETWELFKAKGFDAIINDDLTSTVLMMSSIFAGLLSGAVTAAVAYLYVKSDEWFAWTAVAFIVGYGLALCAVVVVRSGVATIFVCFAEDPAVLADTKPAQYDKITKAWQARYGRLPARLTNPNRPPAV